jgi:hypothetical protein
MQANILRYSLPELSEGWQRSTQPDGSGTAASAMANTNITNTWVKHLNSA